MSATSKKNRIITDKHRAAAANLKRIWQERRQQDKTLTQERIAGQLDGITQGAVSQYMNATMALNAEAILKFASLFEVPPEAIWPDFMQDFASAGGRPAPPRLQVMDGGGKTKTRKLSDDERMEMAVEFVEEMLTDLWPIPAKEKAHIIKLTYDLITPTGEIDLRKAATLVATSAARNKE